MKLHTTLCAVWIMLCFSQMSPIQAQVSGSTLYLKISNSQTKEALFSATCAIKSLGLFGITDFNGYATISSIPVGRHELEVRCLNYQTQTVVVEGPFADTLRIELEETTLKLKEVVVTARSSAAGSATGSQIGRQAIDHLQANSLKDLMELLPGQVATNNDLTSKQQLQIRTVNGGDGNNAFGTSVIIDGVPVSNNTNVGSTGGVDLRAIGTDDIESVEVIRGIPSAEYGDLTSGAVVIRSKTGASPYELRVKVNPTTTNGSIAKGFKFKNNASMNINANYAQAWGDPRSKTKSFDRTGASVNYAQKLGKVYTNNRFRINSLVDRSKRDPDQLQDGIYSESKDLSLSFSHDGRISIGKPWSSSINYVAGFNTANRSSFSRSTVAANGFKPILQSLRTGYFETPYVTKSYSATGGSESSPLSFYGKINNQFSANHKEFRNLFKMGIEYRFEQNKGLGDYDTDSLRPLNPNSTGRPRPFYDIPALHQLSAFIEDNMSYKINNRRLRLTIGIRFQMLQPGMSEQVWSVSPRMNFSAEVFSWLDFRAGYGIASKTPGLSHLYPDKKYVDRLAADFAYYNPNDLDEMLRYMVYHTYVIDIQKSPNLRNSNNHKVEMGLDFKLDRQRKLSLVTYYELAPGGFGAYSEYMLYLANIYATPPVGVGRPSLPVTPSQIDTVWTTTGQTGNTKWEKNYGIELEADLGKIPAINTSFFVTGAFAETQGKTTGPNYSSPAKFSSNMTPIYHDIATPPFKVEYPSGEQTNIDRRLSTTIRAVHHIPRLGLVFSAAFQTIWYVSSQTTNQREDPIAFWRYDSDLKLHRTEVTPEMLNDPDYEFFPGYKLSDERRDPKDNPVNISPITWQFNLRLTKQISSYGSLSFFANNFLYYEPWLHGNTTTTLAERNVGSFNFGLELTVKL